MLKIVLIVFVLAIAGVLIVAATKPDTFHVERSIVIAAKPEAIQPLVEDFHQWRSWSPYENKDPAMQRTFGGADQGVGATYAWKGNGKVGAGQMTIREASPAGVRVQLDFLEPMTSNNTALFAFKPDGDGTRVTWSMDGPANFISKLMDTIFNMDKMVGRDFDTGLASLKAAAERH